MSFVFARMGEGDVRLFWCETSDSHEEIKRVHGLRDTRDAICPIEVFPPDGQAFDPNVETWPVVFDSGYRAEWLTDDIMALHRPVINDQLRRFVCGAGEQVVSVRGWAYGSAQQTVNGGEGWAYGSAQQTVNGGEGWASGSAQQTVNGGVGWAYGSAQQTVNGGVGRRF